MTLQRICDRCGSGIKVADSHTVPSEFCNEWVLGTEVGDLCHGCYAAWERVKYEFVRPVQVK